ncbi:hypothetical protein LJ737_19970 [Hymenobacter sp. 15J16-1T3B]|uniref:hypothetical protein n=1 Tax=Hymenobacter sp. 15J16-1T3B TaxID=2886941 RepID=UPI001D11636F|nr:hypothetical protein [Hymenobacter sp. 15J16-1T3B]MCC3159530.1 hypothetical protein [Hymenobacter sp. 15J16-1T3B]
MARNPYPGNVIDPLQPAPTAYRVDWARLVLLLLPALLRRPRQWAWLQVLTAPVARLHLDFISYLFASRRELSYSSQVLLFERALNDRFDPIRRRIVIRNADTEYAITYWNFVHEQQPVTEYLPQRHEAPPFPRPFRYWAEYAGQTDFTVIAPLVLRPRAVELHALIRRLKLATKHYSLLFQNL